MEALGMSRRTLAFGASLLIVLTAGVLTGFAAEQRALQAEEAYVAEQLRNESCLTSWGVDEGAVAKRSSIEGITAGGVRVSVEMPYAHTSEEDGETVFADSGSEAVYVVTATDTRRLRGDSIEIC